MSSSIVPLNFEGNEVRTVCGFTARDGSLVEMGWVLADVCACLAISNPSNWAAALDADEVGTLDIVEGALGGPDRLVISEPGLYKLLTRSRKPEAKRFDRWVRHEVLPSIRKTGAYAIPPRVENDLGRISRTARRPSIGLMKRALQACYGEVMQPATMARLTVEAVQTVYPELQCVVLPGLASLPAAPVEEKTYTPTEIGTMLGQRLGRAPLSAQWVNAQLATWGFQHKDLVGGWLASSTDHALLGFVRVQGTRSSCKVHTRQQLRWKASLLDAILPLAQEALAPS